MEARKNEKNEARGILKVFKVSWAFLYFPSQGDM